MTKGPLPQAEVLLEKLRKDLEGLATEVGSAQLSAPSRRRLNDALGSAASDLQALLAKLDPIARPSAVFDPGNPRTIGFFIALALTAQPRRPLSKLQPFHGSGVYAIYYSGSFPLYSPIRNTETPIYVGQAAPHQQGAMTPVAQGTRLAARLNEHRKNIERACQSLDINDFDYRALVVQTGWETGAEDYLIRLFRPIWNSETKLVFGIGKHGDDADTRRNKRSPWDTLHPGRTWAAKSAEDAKSAAKIKTELADHFAKHPPFKRLNDVLASFVDALRQT